MTTTVYEITALLSRKLGLMREPMILSDLLAEEMDTGRRLNEMRARTIQYRKFLAFTQTNYGPTN